MNAPSRSILTKSLKMLISMTFDKVTLTATKYVMVDGKKRRRQKTFWQTFNPYNVNEDGRQKSRQEIRAELAAEARAWEKDGSLGAD